LQGIIPARSIPPAVFDLAQSLSAIGWYLIAMAGQSLFPVVSCICLGDLDRTAPTAPVGAVFFVTRSNGDRTGAALFRYDRRRP